VYYQYQFENMIEGSEELKAYIYEAAHFRRVDLEMYEQKTYHSFYMNTPKLANWNRTHGGPYYAEVGKDISIDYNTMVSQVVRAYDGNETVVNSTSNGTVEVKTKKSWIYYEYEPSNVEYYYYKDCVVKDMGPHSALTSGGTVVSVIGAWFKYFPQYGVVPHCK